MEEKEKKGELNLKKLKEELNKCQKLRDEYLAGWQKERADFLNYKKEELERIGELMKYANMELILKMLPILDNFDIVERKLPNDLKNNENVKGILQIKSQLKELLKKQGIEEIESVGKPFDPHIHEAIEEVEEKNKESGMVIEEIQKGYKIDNKILRPAKVKVSK